MKEEYKLARPVKKTQHQWKNEILNAAQNLFITKGYQKTSISDIMKEVEGAKGMFGLQKIKELLLLNQSDTKRNDINMQAISILKDPHILASAIESNRKVLTPLWYELLEEGKNDGSIQTEYTKELSELLPLINFWLLPSVYHATADEIYHKYCFIMEVLCHMGLPIIDDSMLLSAKKIFTDAVEK